MDKFPVYVITCSHPSYGRKSYVGCVITEGKTVEDRFEEHLSGKGCAPYLRNAINKYGREWFSVQRIDAGVTPEHALKLEKFWVTELKTKIPTGYNLTDGGEGVVGYEFTGEAKAKMSRAQKNTNPETKARRLSYLVTARTPEHQRMAASKSWVASDKQKAHVKKMASLPRTEKQIEACNRNGVETMRLHGDRIRSLRKREDFVKNGKIQGRRAVESGQLAKARQAPLSAEGRLGRGTSAHIRWHVNRDYASTKCKLCLGG